MSNYMWREMLMAVSIMGTALITMDERMRFIAFVLFSVTDTGWMVDAFIRRDREQFLMYFVYDLFNIMGLANNIHGVI
jgi:hypothetical protein